MNEFDFVQLIKFCGWIILFAPPVLALIRGAWMPAILAGVLSAVGLGAIVLGMSSSIDGVARIMRGYEPLSPMAEAMAVDRLGAALAIVGSAVWIGAMIAGLAGYMARPFFAGRR